ncbi:MAG: DEAD/DEAH box helicase, partial [Acidimicrobiaceae bacterium]
MRHVDTFGELGVNDRLVEVLARDGIVKPFPIQCATLPDSLAGRDVLGRGKTGSGKTIAFALPLVAALAASPRRIQAGRPRGLILVPTRELANQVAEIVAPLAAAMSLKVTTIFGGVGQSPQVSALRSGVDIVVACPGRLEDLIQQRHCRLDAVEVTVLDEADHMADLGFLPAVRRLLDATPSGTQRLLFSATLDNGINVLVSRFLQNPVVHSVDPEVAPVSTMTHHVFAVSVADKPAVVRALARSASITPIVTQVHPT